MSFWDIIWFIFITYVFVAYLIVMFRIVMDIFRDHESSGVARACWIVGLLFLPILVMVIYLATRGRGMGERRFQAARAAQHKQDISELVSRAAPADQIAQAKTMLEAGVISQSEFDRIKEKALS